MSRPHTLLNVHLFIFGGGGWCLYKYEIVIYYSTQYGFIKKKNYVVIWYNLELYYSIHNAWYMYISFVSKEHTYIIVKMDVSLFILEIKFLIAEGYISQNHNEIYFYGVRMSILLISYKEKTHFFVIWYVFCLHHLLPFNFFFQYGLIFQLKLLVQSDLDIKTETFFINTRWKDFFTNHKYKVMRLISCFW